MRVPPAAENPSFAGGAQDGVCRTLTSRKPFVAISINHFVVAGRARRMEDSPQPSRLRAEWRPSAEFDRADGDALQDALYGPNGSPRAWCAGSTAMLVSRAMLVVSDLLDEIEAGMRRPSIEILDYGTGTGLAAFELLKACDRLLNRARSLGVKFQLHVVDLPTNWFAVGYERLRSYDFVRFHSLRERAAVPFVPLANLVGRERIDLILASMVLHLVPTRALSRLFADLASVLRGSGVLLWNSPDIAPAPPDSVLFHDPNRLLRRRLLQILDRPDSIIQVLDRVSVVDRTQYKDLVETLKSVRVQLTDERRARAASVAERQILTTPTHADCVRQHLAPYFDGQLATRKFEIVPDDSVRTILVPSNLNYLSEIEDASLRQHVAHLLMWHDVLPSIQKTPAATIDGFNVHWTFGEYRVRGGHQ